nr:competence type IV pilus assembly protein ComGB [Bacillus alkalicola]
MERCEWLERLHSLLSEGYSLSYSLLMLKEFETESGRRWCESVYDALQSGEEFIYPLREGGFSKEVINCIFLADKYGDLREGLIQGALILKKKYELSQKGRKMLSYPIFLFFGLLIMIGIMSEGVFPHFTMFFDSMGQDLPWLTKLVVSLLSFFQLPVLLLIFTIVLGVIIWFRRKTLNEQLTLLLKLPILRSVTKSFLTYYFASQLAPLLENGFSLHQSLLILKEHSQISFFQNEADAISNDLRNGFLLSESIRNRPYYEVQLASVIAFGEAKGSVGKELERFSNILFNRFYEKLQKLLSVSQPVLIGGIGFIVMVLFLSMMLPIFNIVDGW